VLADRLLRTPDAMVGMCADIASWPIHVGGSPAIAAASLAWAAQSPMFAKSAEMSQAEAAGFQQGTQLLEQLVVHLFKERGEDICMTRFGFRTDDDAVPRPKPQLLHVHDSLPQISGMHLDEQQHVQGLHCEGHPSEIPLPSLLGDLASAPLLPSSARTAPKCGPPPGLPPPSPRMASRGDTSGPPLGLSKCSPKVPVATAPVRELELGNPIFEVVSHSSGLCTVVWRIESLSSKLKASRGFPLLSPAFDLAGLLGLRVLFAPGDEWMELAGASRKQKQRRLKAKDSPSEVTFGTLKVKAGDINADMRPCQFRALLSGSCQAGPATSCDFSEEVVQSCDLTVDWRKFVNGNSLTFHVQFEWMSSVDS